LRFAVLDRHSESDLYKASQHVHPFLQSCAGEVGLAPDDPKADAEEDLFTFVECWCEDDKAQAWVDFLNANADEYKTDWESRRW
jgi:hypothetical protein